MRTILKRASFAAGTGLMLTSAAFAAEATPGGGAEIKAGLERYVGQGALTVTPQGGAYRLDLDVKAMLQALERFGVTLDPATYTVTVAPDGDGIWHVTSGGLPAITAHFGGQTSSIVSNGQSFDGRYDARIPAFTRWSGHYDSMSIGVTGTGTATQARQLAQGEQTFSATPAGDGVIDGTFSQTNTSFSQDVAVDDPRTHFDLSVKSGPTRDSITIEGMRVRAATDLWAYLVAHSSFESIKASQADLRTRLRELLPLFQRFAQENDFEAVTVKTPAGTFGAGHLATRFDLHGLTADGLAGLSVKIDGLTGPTDKLPRWSAAIVPTAVELKTAISGFRLDEAARAVVDEFDLAAQDPLPQATRDKLVAMLGPRDKMLVTIGASRITSPTVDVQFSGDIHLTVPLPTITLAVHATGLDKAIAAAQAAAKQDTTAAQAIAVLMLAKAFGKAEPDGGLSWAIVVDPAGAATVNGVPLPAGKGN